MNDNRFKVILDLCGGTGSWSRPYAEAGYSVEVVTLPEFDLMRTRFDGEFIIFVGGCDESERSLHVRKSEVYGILAAPTCTMFSMARTVAKTPRDLRGAMELVNMCLSIIHECQYSGSRLKFWALENPKARLRWFLGIPALTFNPYDYGDPHRKPTDIWGNFNIRLRTNRVDLDPVQKKQSHLNRQQLPPLPAGYVLPGNFDRRAAQRSVTPRGFAQAFFLANK